MAVEFTSWGDSPRSPSRKALLAQALEMDADVDYQCVECLKYIRGVPYARIEGGLMAYDGESHLRMQLSWLCRPCWHIECLGAGVQW